MIAVVADGHGEVDARLGGQVAEAVESADLTVHAGDLTSAAALEALETRANDLSAVHGNADEGAVRERLPAERTVEAGGVRIAVCHGDRGSPTGLAMFGRERAADLVVSGHTHRPSVREGSPTLLNPGSYADPRGGPATFAELRTTERGLTGTVVTHDGDRVESFQVRRDASGRREGQSGGS